MKNARPLSESSANPQHNFTPEAANNKAGKFLGTSNPRHLRAIWALLTRPMPREALDDAAGASNSPDLIRELRARGLDVPCHKVEVIDRDGRVVLRGVYHLTARDRQRIAAWMRTRSGGAQ